jgi:hypothetical protein
VQSTPTCAAGAVQVWYDLQGTTGAGQCALAATPAEMSNSPAGGCDTDMFTGSPPTIYYANLDLRYVPPLVSGGQCASTGQTTGNVSYSSHDRACAADSVTCVGARCTVTAPAPYAVCVAKSGSQSCPGAPFTQQHVVGTIATLTCTLSATCTGTMKLFTDNQCKNGELDLPADGLCHATGAPASISYHSYTYMGSAPAGVACAATGTSTAQDVTLAGEQTVCCTQ